MIKNLEELKLIKYLYDNDRDIFDYYVNKNLHFRHIKNFNEEEKKELLKKVDDKDFKKEYTKLRKEKLEKDIIKAVKQNDNTLLSNLVENLKNNDDGEIYNEEFFINNIDKLLEKTEHYKIPQIIINEHLDGGFKENTLALIGALPGVGKTSLLINWFINYIKNDVKTTFLSLELNRWIVLKKIISSLSLMPLVVLESNFEELKKLIVYFYKTFYSNNNFYIEDNAFYIEDIEKIIRQKAKQGHKIFFIDYYQKIEVRDTDKLGTNPLERTNLISERLMRLKKELNIIIILAVAVNKEVTNKVKEYATDYIPDYLDIRENSKISYDSDIIITMSNVTNYIERLEEYLDKLLSAPGDKQSLGDKLKILSTQRKIRQLHLPTQHLSYVHGKKPERLLAKIGKNRFGELVDVIYIDAYRQYCKFFTPYIDDNSKLNWEPENFVNEHFVNIDRSKFGTIKQKVKQSPKLAWANADDPGKKDRLKNKEDQLPRLKVKGGR